MDNKNISFQVNWLLVYLK